MKIMKVFFFFYMMGKSWVGYDRMGKTQCQFASTATVETSNMKKVSFRQFYDVKTKLKNCGIVGATARLLSAPNVCSTCTNF